MTAFYMFRLYWMTFGGQFRGTEEQEHHLHESPRSMVVPLQILAAGSIVAGFVGIPAVLGGGNWIEHFLHPVFASAHHALERVLPTTVQGHGVEIGLMLASVAIAAAGIGLAWYLYAARPALPERLAAAFPRLYRTLLGKYFVDEIYGVLFVRGLTLGGGEVLHAVDRYVVDGGNGEVRAGVGVNGVAWGVRDLVGRASDLWDRWVVDGAVNLTALILENLSYVFRAVQNGLVQHYAWVMLLGVLLLIGVGPFLR